MAIQRMTHIVWYGRWVLKQWCGYTVWGMYYYW